jgi:hypothetical protein
MQARRTEIRKLGQYDPKTGDERGSGAMDLETDDAVVLVLGPGTDSTSAGRLNGVTRLEKLVFLLEREQDLGKLITDAAQYESHNFGPFSKKVYEAVDVLEAAGLLRRRTVSAGSAEDSWESQDVLGSEDVAQYAERQFELTDDGMRYYRALLSELPKGTERDLRSFKQAFGAMSLRQLLRYVYERYPEFTDKSIIRQQVLGR